MAGKGSLNGKVAAVTGGASGIGEASADRWNEILNVDLMSHAFCAKSARREDEAYLIASSSTSKISVALGGMTPPAPRAP